MTLIDVVTSLSGGAINTLRAAFKAGPLDDGDVPSKAGRDELVSLGLMVKVIIKGDWGYNACTYKGAYGVRGLDEKVAGESVARHHQPLDKALPG
ncbi:hypothetical protein [Bradyrhizobium sp. LMG 9283]|uniref:hypothetical protein n=1 Tax=Bradyrhizobium sp. LMG 9283 TaxID=592064 RepID=UPI00388EF5F1